MKLPRLPGELTWFLDKSAIAVLSGISSEVSVYPMSHRPPHTVPLIAQWSPPENRIFGALVDVWVGVVTVEARKAMSQSDRDAIIARLRTWITDALAASPVWKSQVHRIEWQLEGSRIVLIDDDLNPKDHRA